MKQRKKTTWHLQKIHSRSRIVFLRSSTTCFLCVLFSVLSILVMKVCRTPLFALFSGGFLNQLPHRRWLSLVCRRQTHSAMKTNAFHAGDKPFSTGDEHVENKLSNFSHTHIQLAISDFQTDLLSRGLLLKGTHIWKQVVSHSCTHLWVRYTYK